MNLTYESEDIESPNECNKMTIIPIISEKQSFFQNIFKFLTERKMTVYSFFSSLKLNQKSVEKMFSENKEIKRLCDRYYNYRDNYLLKKLFITIPSMKIEGYDSEDINENMMF